MDDIDQGVICVHINVIAHSEDKILSFLCVLPLTVVHLFQLEFMSIPDGMTDKVIVLVFCVSYMQCFVEPAMEQFLSILDFQVQNRFIRRQIVPLDLLLRYDQ